MCVYCETDWPPPLLSWPTSLVSSIHPSPHTPAAACSHHLSLTSFPISNTSLPRLPLIYTYSSIPPFAVHVHVRSLRLSEMVQETSIPLLVAVSAYVIDQTIYTHSLQLMSSLTAVFPTSRPSEGQPNYPSLVVIHPSGPVTFSSTFTLLAISLFIVQSLWNPSQACTMFKF